MIRCAVLFDMDGTLALSEETHHRALADVLQDLGIEKPDQFDAKMTGQSMHALYAALKQHTSLSLSYAQLAAAKNQAFLSRIDELRWRPGAREAMKAAHEAGYHVAVVTNSDRILLDASLRLLGITIPDQITVSRNDVKEGKPQPEPYLRAAWLLGLPPSACVVVEDSHAGATAGIRAGMRVIGWPEAAHNMQFPDGVCIADSHTLWPTLKTQLDSLANFNN